MNKILMLIAVLLIVISTVALTYIATDPDPMPIAGECGSLPPGPNGIVSGVHVCRDQRAVNWIGVAIPAVGLTSGVALATYGIIKHNRRRRK